MIDLLGYKVKPIIVAFLSIALAIISLASALIAEHVFGLLPCNLCLYQRIPYVVIILLGLMAIVSRTARKPYAISMWLTAVTYAVGTYIAAFHTGVERHWWSYASDCTVNVGDSLDTTESFLAAIKTSPVVRCDEIPWSFLGLSFANYNALFSAGMTIVFLYVGYRVWFNKAS